LTAPPAYDLIVGEAGKGATVAKRMLVGCVVVVVAFGTGCSALGHQPTTVGPTSVTEQSAATASSIPTTSAPPTTATTPVTAAPPSTTTTTAATTTTTSTTTTVVATTLRGVDTLAAGLFCRDLVATGYSYPDAVAYWTREGRPDRMDADRNGIPCETVYDSTLVVAFWGDPLPTTTTTAVDIWYSVVNPEYQVPSLPGAGTDYGSGCSPGSTALPDGIWFGRIEGVNASSISFDLMCFGPGPEGPGTITNTNPKVRSVPVDAGAGVYRVFDAGGIAWELVSYTTWLSLPPDPALCPPEGCRLAWLYVNDEHVTEVVELFFP
jgi:hypothetical protein